MLIYNLFPPLVGPCAEWEPHLLRARELGFRWILCGPIHEPGEHGSVFAVANFRQLHPVIVDAHSRLSPEAQLRAALGRAKELGLSLMATLVLDGVSPDSPLVAKHPHWFASADDLLDMGMEESPETSVVLDDGVASFAWTRRPDGLLNFALSIVEWLLDLGFDAFLCHAAHRVPGSVWGEIIRRARTRHPEVRFLADTLGCTAFQTRDMARHGFQAVLNSSKWWDFHQGWLMSQYSLVRDVLPSISFPESHETERLSQEVGGNVAALRQRWFFSALFATGAMMPVGYEFGFRKRLDVVRTRPDDWESPSCDLTDYIRRVNVLKMSHPVFRSECPTAILPHDNPNVLLMWKGAVEGDQEALILLNKDVLRPQRFHGGDLRRFVVGASPLRDASPEERLPEMPRPFDLELRPGEGRVFLTAE